MFKDTPLTIVNVGYLSTNYWVVSAGRSRLLVDLGYPGTMGTMRARLKQMDIPLKEIRYAMATHYHIDHAGLAQELKLAGVHLLVLDVQVPAIPLMKQFTKPRDHFVEIVMDDNVVISSAESRMVLEKFGIPGEILPTPGHSDDSVSLLLDDGSVFTGDLTPFELAWGDSSQLVTASWHLLKGKGARRVNPGHGPVRLIPSISDKGSQNGSSPN
jgi:ribonuclease/clavin/mitogillin